MTVTGLMSAAALQRLVRTLPSIRAIRNKLVTARPAVTGDVVIGLKEGPEGQLELCTSVVPETPGHVITFSIEGQLSSHFVPQDQFEAEFEHTSGSAFLAKSERCTMYVTDRTLRFLTPAGEVCTVYPGGMLIPEGEGFVGMNPKTFAATHSITHSRQEARRLLPPQEPGSRLFSSWFEIESSGRTAYEILKDLNGSCGTKYQHGWLSRMRHDPTRKGERIPRNVRAYMMMRVLRHELVELGLQPSTSDVQALVERML